MADELDDLKAAFDAATPAPDEARKRENIALAEKNFADLQGSRDAARLTVRKGRMSRLLDGVKPMFHALSTKGALTVTTAIVAVGLLVVLPKDAMKLPGGGDVLTQSEGAAPPVVEQPKVADDASGGATGATSSVAAAEPLVELAPAPVAPSADGLSRSLRTEDSRWPNRPRRKRPSPSPTPTWRPLPRA